MSTTKANTCRDWLMTHGYADLAEKIDHLQNKWKRDGKKTRRDWFETLAGTRDGDQRTVDGVTFPILAAMRRRAGYKAVPHAVERFEGERAPRVFERGRWPVGHVPHTGPRAPRVAARRPRKKARAKRR